MLRNVFTKTLWDTRRSLLGWALAISAVAVMYAAFWPTVNTPEIQDALRGLEGWQVVDGMVHRTYRFKDLVEAMGFMTSGAMIVQQLDHHPEWFNVYNKVEVTLATHDAGGVTERDIKLAQAMDRLAKASEGA